MAETTNEDCLVVLGTPLAGLIKPAEATISHRHFYIWTLFANCILSSVALPPCIVLEHICH